MGVERWVMGRGLEREGEGGGRRGVGTVGFFILFVCMFVCLFDNQ